MLLVGAVAALALPSCRLYTTSEGMAEPTTALALDAEESAAANGWTQLGAEASAEGRQRLVIPVHPETLDEEAAVRRGMSRSLAVGLAEIAEADARANADLTQAAVHPKLVGVFDLGDDGERLPTNVLRPSDDEIGAGMYLQQDILTWGANRSRIAAAQEREGREEALREMLQNDTAAAVHIAFAMLRRIEASRKACAQAAEAYRAFRKQAESRIGAGVEAEGSLTNVDSRLADLETRRALLDIERETTETILRQTLGLPAATQFSLQPEPTIASPADGTAADALVASARESRPDIAALENEVRAAEHGIAAAKADRLPKISVSAGGRSETDVDFSDYDTEFTAGVRSRWVPFDGGAHKARIALAENRLAAARLTLEDATESAATEVRSAIDMLAKTRAVRDAATRAVDLTRKSLELAAQQQEASRTGIEQILNTQERLYQATLQEASARFAERRATVLLGRAVGAFVHASPQEPQPEPAVSQIGSVPISAFAAYGK